MAKFSYGKPSGGRLGKPSASTRARVDVVREHQRHRLEGTALLTNADMGPAEVRLYCPLDDAGRSLLRAAMQQLQMSARAYHRTLKLARTIADPSILSGQAWRGVTSVTVNGKIPKKGKIKIPTLVKWSHLRHNGLVSRSAEEWTTYAKSGESIHDQRPTP